jgi:hypothetical protein
MRLSGRIFSSGCNGWDATDLAKGMLYEGIPSLTLGVEWRGAVEAIVCCWMAV